MIEVISSFDLVNTSYSRDDVVVLLKDLTNKMKEQSTEDRERAIQSGAHYSEMLPLENKPSEEYSNLYNKALCSHKKKVAEHVAKVSEIMYARREENQPPIIISLARAGIPIGILIKRYIKLWYNVDCPHYAISIIRDKGIDANAMNYIYNKEVKFNGNKVSNFFFVDGWTGKGAIKNQLDEAVDELKNKDEKWKDLSHDLYVLADPANITEFCGTHDDYLIPSSCLNSTVSGLTSRTILNDFIHLDDCDFHGAVYFERFKNIDESNSLLDIISEEFSKITCEKNGKPNKVSGEPGMKVVERLCKEYGINDYKKVKPGIGETTRVLLRRLPYKVLVNNKFGFDKAEIDHIINLCKEKSVPVEETDLGNCYKVCGIIKELSADA